MRFAWSWGVLWLLLAVAQGQTLRGFDNNAPRVSVRDSSLVVEQVWRFDRYHDRAIQLRFVPGSEQVVTVQKSGVLRLYPNVDASVNDYDTLLDIRSRVHDNGDLGVMAFHFHPDFDKGVTEGYLLYTGEPLYVDQLPNPNVAQLRPDGWGRRANNGFSWYDGCPCLNCDGRGRNEFGNICEKVIYLDRISFDLTANPPRARRENRLYTSACIGSSSHTGGNIDITNEKDLVFTTGDGAQWKRINGQPDWGLEESGCFDPSAGPDQGQFRSQRDNFKHGKLTRIPYELLTSTKELFGDDVEVMAKGLRQPYRTFYHKASDKLYIADVGSGDSGLYTERIFSKNMSDGCKSNFGWPCIEGVRPRPLDGRYEVERQNYLRANGRYETCNPVYKAARDYMTGGRTPGADRCFRAPHFEYRGRVHDNDKGECKTNTAAISGIHIYEGNEFPRLKNKLIFSDHAKQCLWYFEDNYSDGSPDFSSRPKLLISGDGYVDIQTGPDGYLYMVDYSRGRIVRAYDRDADSTAAAVVTPAPTPAPTSPPFDATGLPIAKLTAESLCTRDPYNMTDLAWVENEDGSMAATLTYGTIEYNNKYGETRTRAYNGLLPGPVIRMKACNTYKLTLSNELAGWPNPGGPMNTMKDPGVTNIHVHGLHISGKEPHDNVFVEVLPGESYEYTYDIPCDHSGGTFWYHTHHHGSSTIQTGAGSAGMIIIEDSLLDRVSMPKAYSSMQEALLVVQEMLPADTVEAAVNSGDELYQTTAVAEHYLVNGCDNTVLTLKEGEWTRLRIAFVGHEDNVKMELLEAEACEVNLLAKDGVTLSKVPRPLPGQAAFFTPASRVDLAVKCPVGTASDVYRLGLSIVGGAMDQIPFELATVVVEEGDGEESPPLPVWEPCRPNYLSDLTSLSSDEILGDVFTLEIRETLNGKVWTGEDDPLGVINVDQIYEWNLNGHGKHPLHMHINHFQVHSFSSQWDLPGLENWFQVGDWLDTISNPGPVIVRFPTDRFSGPMVLHCHVLKHGDTGVMAVMHINATSEEDTIASERLNAAVTAIGRCELPALPIPEAEEDEEAEDEEDEELTEEELEERVEKELEAVEKELETSAAASLRGENWLLLPVTLLVTAGMRVVG